MAKTELVLRPGDSVTLRLEVGSQSLTLEMNLSSAGLSVGSAPSATRYIPAAAMSTKGQKAEPDWENEETSGSSEEAQQVSDSEQDIDLELSDLESGEIEVVSPASARAPSPAPAESFNPRGMTNLPPTRKIQPAPQPMPEPINLESDDAPDEEEPMTGAKPQYAPSQDDTLPVWNGGARGYRDPNLEKKKQTASIKVTPIAPTAAPAEDNLLDLQPITPPGPKKGTRPVMPPVVKPPTAPVKPATRKLPEPRAAGGDFTVFLTPPKEASKKQAAAEIIARIQGVSVGEAQALAGKMIVPVVKNVTEQAAQEIRDMFKDAGLSCRVTQKR